MSQNFPSPRLLHIRQGGGTKPSPSPVALGSRSAKEEIVFGQPVLVLSCIAAFPSSQEPDTSLDQEVLFLLKTRILCISAYFAANRSGSLDEYVRAAEKLAPSVVREWQFLTMNGFDASQNVPSTLLNVLTEPSVEIGVVNVILMANYWMLSRFPDLSSTIADGHVKNVWGFSPKSYRQVSKLAVVHAQPVSTFTLELMHMDSGFFVLLIVAVWNNT
ncbi:hypothetical protein TcWFU_000414 [Taenia crassiceps]|uniref:Uncharacterized protein n=1 Tax=Taenia crassiceps TaxID=6207 RepID=A0ABR4Q393_9CEST